MTDAERMDIARGVVRAIAPLAQPDDRDDMTQDALIAVWRAEETWDGRGTVTGRCYAKAKGAVIDGLRRRAGTGRGRPVGPRKVLEPLGVQDPAAPDDTEAEALARLEVAAVGEWLRGLDPRVAAALRAPAEGVALSVIAERFGVGRNSVSQLRHYWAERRPAA